MCAISSKLTIKATQRRHWRSSSNFIVNFEHIYLHIVRVFLLLTLNKKIPAWKDQRVNNDPKIV